MVASELRILTAHAGSLPRPAAVVSILERQHRGEVVVWRKFQSLGAGAERASRHLWS